jgi:hypothetical protein
MISTIIVNFPSLFLLLLPIKLISTNWLCEKRYAIGAQQKHLIVIHHSMYEVWQSFHHASSFIVHENWRWKMEKMK